MKTAILCTLVAVVTGFSGPRAAGNFSSVWAFGDGVCTTTGSPGGAIYHGNRFCNGPVFIEVLAQWDGLSYVEAQNNSYFGQDSGELLANVSGFTAPPDVGTALFIVWACNADFVEFSNVNIPPYDATDVPPWAAFIAASITDHEAAVTALHAKGVRTIILPNAVDITLAPFYALPAADEAFIRQRTIEFNAAFDAAMRNLAATLPGLTIYLPDTFAFLDDVSNNPGDYGLVNPGIDAVTDLITPALDGPGADYVFWDYLHPTAKVQRHLAALVRQMISPVRIEGFALAGPNLEVMLTNVPIGLGGFLDGSAILTGDWVEYAPITSAAATETIVVPKTGPKRFYRARFPVE